MQSRGLAYQKWYGYFNGIQRCEKQKIPYAPIQWKWKSVYFPAMIVFALFVCASATLPMTSFSPGVASTETNLQWLWHFMFLLRLWRDKYVDELCAFLASIRAVSQSVAGQSHTCGAPSYTSLTFMFCYIIAAIVTACGCSDLYAVVCVCVSFSPGDHISSSNKKMPSNISIFRFHLLHEILFLLTEFYCRVLFIIAHCGTRPQFP